METQGKVEFKWPDPLNPVYITRDFTLVESDKEPLAVTGARLIQLVPDCLYEVVSCDNNEGRRGLRPGSILSRNLLLTEKITNGEDASKHCFVSYDGVYQARRGLGRVDRRGFSHELPDLNKWKGSLDEMVRMSWKLRKRNQGDQARFELIAAQTAEEYAAVRDVRKVAARHCTVKASSITDSKGRYNPGRIPLICFSGQGQIAQRIQAVRGIGRHMSFREAVLEHYIDRLNEICRDVMFSQEYRLSDKWLCGDKKRTPRKVGTEARRLDDAASKLESINTRPFNRAFARSVCDMREAAGALREAAGSKDSNKITCAKEVLARVYRSMRMALQHCRLEELMVQCGIALDGDKGVTESQKRIWCSELRAVKSVLKGRDTVTGQELENGFSNSVLARVLPHLDLAVLALTRSRQEGGPDLKKMYDELRDACSPM
jgi:hypothetical protein